MLPFGLEDYALKYLTASVIIICLKSLVALAQDFDSHRTFRAETAGKGWAEAPLKSCFEAAKTGLLVEQHRVHTPAKDRYIGSNQRENSVTDRYYLTENTMRIYHLRTDHNPRRHSGQEDILFLHCKVAAPAVYKDGLYIKGTSP